MSKPKVLDQPDLWVQCTCGTPYVYRQCFSFTQSGAKTQWLWQRDCKNTRANPAKDHEARMWCVDGEYKPDEAAAS